MLLPRALRRLSTQVRAETAANGRHRRQALVAGRSDFCEQSRRFAPVRRGPRSTPTPSPSCFISRFWPTCPGANASAQATPPQRQRAEIAGPSQAMQRSLTGLKALHWRSGLKASEIDNSTICYRIIRLSLTINAETPLLSCSLSVLTCTEATNPLFLLALTIRSMPRKAKKRFLI